MIRIPGKIPIRIFPFFWIMVILISWLNSGTVQGIIIWSLVIIFSVIFHEYGHALTALAFGQKSKIDLVGFGGVTQREGKRLSLWKEFLIVLNGPLMGILIFVIATILKNVLRNQISYYGFYFFDVTIFVNLVWSLLNLLPIQPLDGGRLFGITCEALFGYKGYKFSFLFGAVLGAFFGFYFFSLQFLIAGILFLVLAFESYRSWYALRGISESDRNEDLQEDFKNAESNLRMGNLEEAFVQFSQIAHKSKKGVLHHASQEYMGQILYEQQNYDQAYSIFQAIYPDLTKKSFRELVELAYMQKDYRNGIKFGEKGFNKYPDSKIALMIAYNYGQLGEAQPAAGWLHRAWEEKEMNLETIIEKPDFDKVRDSKYFQELKRD